MKLSKNRVSKIKLRKNHSRKKGLLERKVDTKIQRKRQTTRKYQKKNYEKI